MHNSSAVRTQGDGTESPEVGPSEATFKKHSKASSDRGEKIDKLGKDYLSKQQTSTILYDPAKVDKESYNFPPPVLPKGKRFYLIPKLVKHPEAARGLKNRKLNLVLMEPYRVSGSSSMDGCMDGTSSNRARLNNSSFQACVNPIFPYKNHENRVKVPSRNNLDLNDLVKSLNISVSEASRDMTDCSPLALLKRERDSFEAQLKFQTQVNTELKGLLVHCLGEDLQTKVNNLTEDNFKIAKSLSTNTEQIEFLASQSEVWRSKFLASSLMVEELARVKTSFAQKNAMLMASNKVSV